jgi:hypothetical protein
MRKTRKKMMAIFVKCVSIDKERRRGSREGPMKIEKR